MKLISRVPFWPFSAWNVRNPRVPRKVSGEWRKKFGQARLVIYLECRSRRVAFLKARPVRSFAPLFYAKNPNKHHIDHRQRHKQIGNVQFLRFRCSHSFKTAIFTSARWENFAVESKCYYHWIAFVWNICVQRWRSSVAENFNIIPFAFIWFLLFSSEKSVTRSRNGAELLLSRRDTFLICLRFMAAERKPLWFPALHFSFRRE